MSETTYDIKFQAKADTASLEQVENRLKQINAEIEKMSRSGNFGPDLTKLVNEETGLKMQQLKLQTVGAPSPAAQAGAAALPEAAGVAGSGLSGLAVGGIAAGVAVAAVATAVVAAGAAMVAAAGQASDLAQELDKLDSPGKAERIRELGDLGEVLDRNGQILLEYGRSWDEIKTKPGDFIAGFGSAVTPVISEVAGKLEDVQAAKAGEDFGLFAKGVLETVTSFEKLKGVLGDGGWWLRPVGESAGAMVAGQRADAATSEAEAAARRARKLAPIEAGRTGDVLGKSADTLMQNRLDPISRATEVEIEREREIQKSLDTGLPEGERNAARKRIEALNKEYAGLDAKIQRVNREAEMELALGAATAAGDSQRVRELNYIKNVQDLTSKGLDEGTAREIADQRDAAAGRQAVAVSALAASGHDRGESRAAAEAALSGNAPLDMQRINETLSRIVTEKKGWEDALENWLRRPEVKALFAP